EKAPGNREIAEIEQPGGYEATLHESSLRRRPRAGGGLRVEGGRGLRVERERHQIASSEIRSTDNSCPARCRWSPTGSTARALARVRARRSGEPNQGTRRTCQPCAPDSRAG